MTSGEAYAKGSYYEFFIRRAFKCERGKHGAETALLQIVIHQEIGVSVLNPKDYEKRLQEVKNYIKKAIEKFMNSKPTPTENTQLIELNDKLSYANNGLSLSDIVAEGLEITKRYRDL